MNTQIPQRNGVDIRDSTINIETNVSQRVFRVKTPLSNNPQDIEKKGIVIIGDVGDTQEDLTFEIKSLIPILSLRVAVTADAIHKMLQVNPSGLLYNILRERHFSITEPELESIFLDEVGIKITSDNCIQITTNRRKVAEYRLSNLFKSRAKEFIGHNLESLDEMQQRGYILLTNEPYPPKERRTILNSNASLKDGKKAFAEVNVMGKQVVLTYDYITDRLMSTAGLNHEEKILTYKSHSGKSIKKISICSIL